MIDEIVKKAISQLGYKEGANNNTKYGKAYGLNYNPWCQMFIWWCANEVKIGTDIIPKTASCPTAYKFFKERKQIISNKDVKKGDIVFYTWDSSNNADHVGIVEKVEGNIFTAIEGNKNDSVERRQVSVSNSCIYAIARPNYTENKAKQTTNITKKDNEYTAFVKGVQKSCGANIDGIAGPETISKTITISRYKNYKHAVVKIVQQYLIYLGYSCGIYGTDGIFGSETEKAVKKYQKDNKCVQDGEITARDKTWKTLLKLI